jgi:NAD(P)-dependent dehydrogenase (short-subunit alcohol dehydrogenase family)
MQTFACVWMVTGAERGLGARIAAGDLEHGDAVADTVRNPQSIIDRFGDRPGLLATLLDAGDPGARGVYVSDGSVVPMSLSFNPSLAISALTEWCCALIAEDHGWAINYNF